MLLFAYFQKNCCLFSCFIMALKIFFKGAKRGLIWKKLQKWRKMIFWIKGKLLIILQIQYISELWNRIRINIGFSKLNFGTMGPNRGCFRANFDFDFFNFSQILEYLFPLPIISMSRKYLIIENIFRHNTWWKTVTNF